MSPPPILAFSVNGGGARRRAGVHVCVRTAASLDLARLGWERYRAKRWRFVFAACALFLFLDALVALTAVRSFAKKGNELNLGGFVAGLSGDGRFTTSAGGNEPRDASSARHALRVTRTRASRRPARCSSFAVIAHFRPTRRLVASAAVALAAASTVRLIGVLILAWATLGVQLYQGAYDVEDVDDDRTSTTPLWRGGHGADHGELPRRHRRHGFVATRVNGVPKAVGVLLRLLHRARCVAGHELWTSVIFETYGSTKTRCAARARAEALIAAYSVLHVAATAPRPGVDRRRHEGGAVDRGARALFETLDRNGDGMIDVDAFLETSTRWRAWRRAGSSGRRTRRLGRRTNVRRTTRFSRPSRPSRLSSPCWPEHGTLSPRDPGRCAVSRSRSSRALAYFQTRDLRAQTRRRRRPTRSSTGWTAVVFCSRSRWQ